MKNQSLIDLIVKMEFGSICYGTNLPTSDIDYKSIYIPSAKQILLGTAKETITKTTKDNPLEKNQAGDIDEETFSLKQYIKLLLEGQTVALDVLFVPDKHIIYPKHAPDFLHKNSFIWDELKTNRAKFLHSGYSSFVGYCKQQASRYGIKGSRVASVRCILEWLKSLDPMKNLNDYGVDQVYRAVCEAGEHASIIELMNAQKTHLEPYLECCNRKASFHLRIKEVLKMYQHIFDEYGVRALQAEKNEGCDWKSLMHAKRICDQAKEVLSTGFITFPRPNADLLLKIRKGEMPYKEVASLIEIGLSEMETASANSVLPKEPDREFAENFIYEVYRNKVING